MSQALVTAVWRSAAPRFLKRGVLGALAIWANDDGTFPRAPTILRLTKHEYLDGGALSERTVRYQLRICERLGLTVAPPFVGGRGKTRDDYALSPIGIEALTIEAVEADKLTRSTHRKGATVAPFLKGAIKGATKGATEANKGGNKGGNAALHIKESTYVQEIRTKPQFSNPKTTTKSQRYRADGRLCPHQPLCHTFGACRDRILSDGRSATFARVANGRG